MSTELIERPITSDIDVMDISHGACGCQYPRYKAGLAFWTLCGIKVDAEEPVEFLDSTDCPMCVEALNHRCPRCKCPSPH